MDESMLVTISVASYNNATYIERCVDSVINQTYENLEILIVDDGSTDDTLSRIDKYKADERVRIVEKENGGLSSVRQRALDEAKGEYISFIDADDYLNEDYVKKLLEQATLLQSDVCLCGVRFENMAGNRLERESKSFSYPDAKEGFKLTHELYADTTQSYKGRFALSDSWNKLYKVSFLRGTGVKFILPKGYNGTDAIFNQKVALHEPVYVTVSYEGYVHVIYKSSAVHRRNKRLQDGFMIQMEQLIEDCERQGIVSLMKDRLVDSYYSYQITAFEDVYKEIGKTFSQSLCTNFKDMRKKHKSFVRKYPFLCDGRLYSRSLNAFKWMLMYLPLAIPVLFSFRRRKL